MARKFDVAAWFAKNVAEPKTPIKVEGYSMKLDGCPWKHSASEAIRLVKEQDGDIRVKSPKGEADGIKFGPTSGTVHQKAVVQMLSAVSRGGDESGETGDGATA